MINRKGFTLIELLVVIAIIALLLSIVIPSLRSARELANRVTCGTNMRGLSQAILTYANDQDDYLPPMRNRSGAQYRQHNHFARFWFMATSSSSDVLATVNSQTGTFWNLGVLWQTNYIDVGKLFYCTGKDVPEEFRYELYSDPSFPAAKKTSPTANTAVRCSYSYNPECLGSNTLEERVMRYTRRTRLPATAVLLADNINASGPPHAGGWNVAYGDGSVSYFRDDDLRRLIAETPNFNGDGRAAWEAWDEIILRMKGH